MNILLDTHILLWAIRNDPKLPVEIRKNILEADRVFVSVVSLWECVIKISINKLNVDFDALISSIRESGFEMLNIKPDHLSQLLKLPFHHRDPFDRLLMAQALAEPLLLQSVDHAMVDYISSRPASDLEALD
jgi:PIN domain nuclease of toxin-antitoxin system